MNSSTINTNTATITINKQLVVDSITVDSTGITTRATTNGDLHKYVFDRQTSTTPYTVSWTRISDSEIDFSIVTSGLSDVRTTTSSPQIGNVIIDGVNTPFSWTGNVNTILVNAGQVIREMFALSVGGGGSYVPSPLTPQQNTTTPAVQNQTVQTPVLPQVQTQFNNPSQLPVDNNTLLIGIALVAVAGVATYIYTRKPKKNTGKSSKTVWNKKKESIEDYNRDIRRRK